MVRQAERDEIITADQADDLLELADLRNAISHGRYGRQNQPIAEPNPDTVRTITKIRDELLQPVSALQLVRSGDDLPAECHHWGAGGGVAWEIPGVFGGKICSATYQR